MRRGRTLAAMVIDQFGGRVIVFGKEGDGNAIVGTNGFGGLVGVRDEEGKNPGRYTRYPIRHWRGVYLR